MNAKHAVIVVAVLVVASGFAFLRSPIDAPSGSRDQPAGQEYGPQGEPRSIRTPVGAESESGDGPSDIVVPVDDHLPVPVEKLPEELPEKVVFVVGKMREYQELFHTEWRVPVAFSISPANARRLVAEYHLLAGAAKDAERQYRDAHHDFITSEVAAGRAILTTQNVNHVIDELERSGRYDPSRDHLGVKAGFEKGAYIVLSKRGAAPALDPQREYCESISAVYSESLRALLGYLRY